MMYRHFKNEGWLYAIAFVIALAVRFIGLGTMPLTDAEAAPALQALYISQSERPALAPHPLYILVTSLLFFMNGGGTDFLARFFPALMGSLLVLAPLLFDNRIKPRSSLILAFFLALDPGLVAISRQAASPILAITFLVFTVGFLNKENRNFATISAALALLSGPAIWFGILVVGITLAFSQFFKKKSIPHEEQGTSSEEQTEIQREPSRQPAPLARNIFRYSDLITFAATFLIAGSLLFTVPNGIGAAFSSVPAFISRWFSPSDTTQGLTFLSLFIYQPLAMLLAIIALVRGWVGGLRRIILTSIWFFVALLLVLFMPARQMADLAWALLPLNTLAALELARYINIHADERREMAGVTLLSVFIWVFAWLGLANINWLQFNTPEYTLRAGLLIGSILLLIVSLLLVAAGWSIRVASLGGIWGMAICLGVLSLGGLFGVTGLRGSNYPELWWQPQTPLHADLLRNTVSQVSEIGTGNDYVGKVVILGVNSPAIEWALHENPVEVVNSLDTTSTPEFVITTAMVNPQLVSAYRGQDFVWRQNLLWNSADPVSWLRWITLREMPSTQETIILWARSDLFLDE